MGVQNDFIATTPFPPVKNVIANQQPSRLNRPFNLLHPFQTNFDQVRITPNTPQISQRPRQRVTTSAPAPPQTTTTITSTTTTTTTTTTAAPTTTSNASDLRKQRIKLLNKTRKTTTPRTSFQPTRKETERTVSAVPATTNRGRGRLIPKTRVRRPINRNKSRRPQVVATTSQEEQNDNVEEVRAIVDRRPVPLPKVRGTTKTITRVVRPEEPTQEPQSLNDFKLRQRQKVKSDQAFLICSEGKCSRPKPGDGRFALNDLKPSSSARVPADNTFNRLFEEMLVNSGIDSEDEEQQRQVLSLLEAAKVQFEEDPETEEFVIDELIETTVAPRIETTTTEIEEETTTTRGLFNSAKRRPFFKPRTQRPSINLKQQELEEELKFEEQLEEAAEA